MVQHLFPKQTKRVCNDWNFKKVGSFSLLVIFWQTFDQAFSTGAFEDVKSNNIVFLVFISIALYVSSTSICVLFSLPWLSKQDTIAVAYCVPSKTPAMGVPLSNAMFLGLSTLVEAKIQIPMVLYQGIQIAGGSLLTIAFRRWLRCEEELEDVEDVEKLISRTTEAELEWRRGWDEIPWRNVPLAPWRSWPT